MLVLVVSLCLLFFVKPLTNCGIWLATIQHSKNRGSLPQNRRNLAILWELLTKNTPQAPIHQQVWDVGRQMVRASLRSWMSVCFGGPL